MNNSRISVYIIFSFFVVAFINQHCQQKSEISLFTKLNPAETNVHFNNKIEDELDRNYFLYDNFYGGAGVGVGDFNNDGLQDVYFAGNIVEDKLYLNKGDFKFEDITNNAGIIHDGGWSSGVTIADVNSDGFVDIFISRELYDDKPELRRNFLYINNQDLTFTNRIAEYGLSDTVRTRHAIFFDYDKDSDLDLFVLNQPPNPGNYSPFFKMVFDGNLIADEFKPILYRNENGYLRNVSGESGINVPGYCNAAISADFNNDGWVDLYVCNDFEVPDFLYINNQDGTFTDQALEQLRHISYFSMGVDAADINDDGWSDIMVLDMAFEGNYRSKSNIGGMNPEKFMNFVKKGWNHQYMFNTLQLNNQNNSFSEIAQLAGVSTTDWSWSNLIVDLDNDGLKDIFVSNGILRDIRNHDGEIALKKYINDQIIKYHKENESLDSIQIWDIIDFRKALNYYPSKEMSNYAFKNVDGLIFENETEDWGLEEPSFSNGSCYADLDNDGDLDLIINNVNKPASIFRNNSEKLSENNYLKIRLLKNGKPGSFFGAKAQITMDGKIQYQELSSGRGMYSSSESNFNFGLGSSQATIDIKVIWPDLKVTELKKANPNQILELDYEDSKLLSPVINETKPTLFLDITHDINLKYKHIENPYNDFESQPFLPYKLSDLGPALAVGDVNNDGLDDFYIGGSTGFSGQLFIQDKNQSFVLSQSMPWFQDRLSEDVAASFFDADQDGDVDLYVVSGGNEYASGTKYYQDRLYINKGNGILIAAENALPPFTASGSCVISTDWDGDGDLDLFIGGRQKPGKYPEPVDSYLLENISETGDNPQFKDVTEFKAPDLKKIGMVTDACWSDYDQDGDLDLILVGTWMGIVIFENEEGSFKRIENSVLSSSSGWWESIGNGDFDNDGDDDFIIGNVGLNYKNKTNQAAPLQVNYGDLDNNGTHDVIFSYMENAIRYPLSGRLETINQFPYLKQRFTNYHSYASASFEEVFPDTKISNLAQYQVNTFASYYVENLGNGDFKLTQLPIAAQLSTIKDLMILDYNNDGNLDVLVAGNQFRIETSVPRLDASNGILLLGDGKGDFSPISTIKSGISLPFNLRNLALAKGTKSQILVASNNSGIIQFFTLSE